MVKIITEFQDINNKYISENNMETTRYINVKIGKNGKAKIMQNGKFMESKKNLPELYLSKTKCCGCTACYTVCPQSGQESDTVFNFRFTLNSQIRKIPFSGAISMLPDEEGFLYPVIDAEKCVRCYKCLQVCPYKD